MRKSGMPGGPWGLPDRKWRVPAGPGAGPDLEWGVPPRARAVSILKSEKPGRHERDAGLERLRLGLTDDMTLPARPRWPLDEARPALIGAGRKGPKA